MNVEIITWVMQFFFLVFINFIMMYLPCFGDFFGEARTHKTRKAIYETLYQFIFFERDIISIISLVTNNASKFFLQNNNNASKF